MLCVKASPVPVAPFPRVIAGALNDGRKSLTRYYLNNYLDAYRQQALDLCQALRSPLAVLREGIQIEVRV